MTEHVMQGRVISNRSSGDIHVLCGDCVFRCRALGKLRRDPPVPGDLVSVRRETEDVGTVLEIIPRKNRLTRPAVANVDRLILVVSEAEPATDRRYIDHMSAMAAYMGAETVLCINKCDIADGDSLRSVYEKAGFRTISVSALRGDGIEVLKTCLADGVTVFAGNSGVGKSSILNRLLPGVGFVTGELSRGIGRGKNTTRHVTLHKSGYGGFVCDTPGFSTFDAIEMGMTDIERLPLCFPELAERLGGCRYTDCGHTTEEDCAIVDAVRAGEIDPERHACYVELFHTLKEYQRRNPELFRKNLRI
ncbi:MAG: ribosome small subunit-dependent GTPase A [Clostridia bacterium]|nr:ribosome small subunit-dependent GTPase A [Clostridia bacterium]